jgi:hypothetical protein
MLYIWEGCKAANFPSLATFPWRLAKLAALAGPVGQHRGRHAPALYVSPLARSTWGLGRRYLLAH